MKVELGVNDVAYHDKAGSATTGDVAEILEANYHVMRTFYELHEQQIGEFVAEAVAGAHRSGFSAKRVTLPGVEHEFRTYLDSGEWEHVSKQVIAAALAGVSHRRKHPYAKRKARRAFVDTGQYEASFRAFLEA